MKALGKVLFILLIAFASSATAAKPIEVSLTTHLGDQQTFIEGDQLAFFLSLDTDAYVYLLYQDAQDQTFVLIPNAKMPGNFYRKGFFLPLPDADTAFRFTIQAPFGDEKIIVFATDAIGLEQLSGSVSHNGLVKVDIDLEQLRSDIESVSNNFGYAELGLTTRSKSDN